DAYWLPFTANRAFKARPRMFTAARGLTLVTDDGREVLDATSGLYCVNAGHGRPEIAQAIAAQAMTLDFAPPFQFAHPAAFTLANRIAALAPGDLDHVLLATSGSEAVEGALKIALAYHRARGEGARTRLIGRERGYHGVGFGGISVGGMVANRKAFGALVTGVDHLSTTYSRAHQAFTAGEPDWGAHLADDLTRLIGLHDASTIAAVIVEPVAGSTGCLPPPKGYLERLRKLTADEGVLLIFDEVITGFGRLGFAFAAERYGVVPDMITFAKGVSNGAAPLSGVIVRKQIHDTLMTGPDHVIELFHGHTYSGHPLSVAAGLATLDIYERDGLFVRARGLEARFAEIMMGLKQAPHVADIRPIGLMCGIDLEPDPGKPGGKGYAMIERTFHDHDLYVRIAGDTLILAPSLTATEDDLVMMRDRIASALSTL
ncbi:MAG: aminotransferase class III-fold pyridoxal phosphate-dependent enzyme, partial [Hyphomicrobiaceae bacterium]|nr:aminotransferase class III-fold pyridoxal phosphate-dependent enzyme [Hyphomicrobiaceae bacterium]